MEKRKPGSFTWTEFYMEFADKLLHYKNNRSELLSILEDVYSELGMRYPFMEKGEPIDDICPFTVFGSFNKGITNENRIAIAGSISKKLGVLNSVPTDFDGIPVLNNMKAWFFGYKDKRKSDDISNLWNVFELGIRYADNLTAELREEFINCYDKVKSQLGVKWNITMGLYWIRPFFYMNLDEKNRSYLLQSNGPYSEDIIKISKLKDLPNAKTYLQLIDYFKNDFKKEKFPHKSFPDLSYSAWKTPILQESSHKISNPGTSQIENGKAETTIIQSEKRYWIYAPGHSAAKWDEFYSLGIMGIGWDELGNLNQYSSKEDMKNELKKLYGQEYTYRNTAHATWQFANELKPGDTIFVKQGTTKVIGRGIVESDYIYDPNRKEYQHIHKVKWTDKGEWEHPGKAVNKTLTDITPYTDYVRKLNNLFIDEEDEDIEEIEVKYDSYTKNEFLHEVFMEESDYSKLVTLLKKKKNIILQGPPGVGKTFAAKRLAFSMMGEKDISRILMVQFHQSYSYEDFIMGYRPTNSGFELSEGPFYEFCKKAEEDSDRNYFFIIDEINRGNLSKIFGELLMLIENDKRGQALRLLYANEQFSVPKNVFIIGMMNTADRSLAMIDYALRRRFAFFTLEPSFDSTGFQELVRKANNPKYEALIAQIKALNIQISQDDSLGNGFKIGHSYLCSNEKITNEWLSLIIEFELIPLLDEYWFDEPNRVEEWTKKLRGVLND